MESYPIRTDLALESQERLKKDRGNVRGIRFFEEKRKNGIIVSTVVIDTENAAKAMGRPKGTYVTIEAPEMIEEDAGYHRDISMELAKILRDMLPKSKFPKISENMETGIDVSVLVVGLGNREVTPDALGPKVVDNMFITRHIINEFGRYAFSDENVSRISGIVPGVMAQTGMECVEILKGIVKETQPELIITVDALAARNVKRLGRTIQLTDTGITPGSGNAATIVADAMSELIEAEASSCQDLEKLDEQQRQELAHGLLSPKLNELFVTPKNIDESIKQLSFLLSEGLNIALLGNKEENVGI